MIARLLDRLRTSRASVLYHRLDGTSDDDGRPWMLSFADARGEGVPQERAEIVAAERTRTVAARFGAIADETPDAIADETPDAGSAMRSEIETAPVDVAATESDPGLVPALNRVADAFERMAASLELEHREREGRLAAVEQLLRELVNGLAQPTAVPPVVVGGSIGPDMSHPRADDRAEIDLSDPQLELEGSDDSPLDAA